jgi:hypothetical protein
MQYGSCLSFLGVNASRVGEQFFEFLGRLGRLAFYIPAIDQCGPEISLYPLRLA